MPCLVWQLLCLVWFSEPCHFWCVNQNHALFDVVTGTMLCWVCKLEPCTLLLGYCNLACWGYWNYALFDVVTETMLCLQWLLEPCFVQCSYQRHALFGMVTGTILCQVWLYESCFVCYWNHAWLVCKLESFFVKVVTGLMLCLVWLQETSSVWCENQKACFYVNTENVSWLMWKLE